MMTCRSIQRLFMMIMLQEQNYPQKEYRKAMEKDLFEVVAQQLEGTDETWSQLNTLDQSQMRFSEEPSWCNLTNFSGNGEMIKRKPMRQIQRQKQAMTSNEACSAKMLANYRQSQQNISLDVQLNRLQKTLNSSKSNSNLYPHFKRQKTLIRRLDIANKQNNQSIKASKCKDNNCMNITSQFLQEIKSVNQELYEVYLSLYRFYEQEKDENAKIELLIKSHSRQLQENQNKLQSQKSHLQETLMQVQTEGRKQTQLQVNFMRQQFINHFEKLSIL